MTKNPIKKKYIIILITGILILLCSYLIHLYNLHDDKEFRKEISKIQDNNVYKKDRIKLTDVIYDNNQAYLKLENIASVLNSKYKENNNKCLLISKDIKLELKTNSKKVKLNNQDYKLKHKIISKYNINFISKEDLEYIYDVIYDNDSRTIFSKYASKILIIKTNNKNVINKTKPIKLINNNGLYIAKYKTIKSTQDAYNILKKQKNISVNIESVIKVSEERNNKKNTNNIIKTEDTDLKKYIAKNNTSKKIIIAMIDSGINYDLDIFENRIINTKYNYSSSGADVKDDFGHGTKITSTIVGTYASSKS